MDRREESVLFLDQLNTVMYANFMTTKLEDHCNQRDFLNSKINELSVMRLFKHVNFPKERKFILRRH